MQININPYLVPTNGSYTELYLGLRPANERWRYFVTMSLIGWAQAKNQPCIHTE